jgi:hypothetical protein
VPDRNGDEPDATDETWCLYDGELVDDELWLAWSQFKPGVRILVLSDSCHSGSVARIYFNTLHAGSAPTLPSMTLAGRGENEPVPRYRVMPSDVAARTYRANRAFYDRLQDSLPTGDEARGQLKDSVGASVLLISGCQDNQLSSDGTFNGLFTANLLRVWDDGQFQGDYRTFHREIRRRMPPTQSPNYFTAGAPDRQFERQEPFTV